MTASQGSARTHGGRFFLAAFLMVAGRCTAQSKTVLLASEPSVPWIEHVDHQQVLNFDLRLQNTGQDTLRVSELVAKVFDPAGRLEFQKTINANGLAPGILVIAPEALPPGGTLDLFNPFFSFAEHVSVARLVYQIHFVVENNPEQAAANRSRLP